MRLLGINAAFHDPAAAVHDPAAAVHDLAAAVAVDGKVVAAAEETAAQLRGSTRFNLGRGGRRDRGVGERSAAVRAGRPGRRVRGPGPVFARRFQPGLEPGSRAVVRR